MKWFKHYSDEEESHLIGELISRYKSNGYYFYMRTLSLMAKHLDVTNPGCNRFNRKWYFLQYYPVIKDERTILKILDFLQSKIEIYYFFVDADIALYCPNLEIRADNCTKKALPDMVEKDKELPPNAGLLHESCINHAKKIALKLYDDAKNNTENKEDR